MKSTYCTLTLLPGIRCSVKAITPCCSEREKDSKRKGRGENLHQTLQSWMWVDIKKFICVAWIPWSLFPIYMSLVTAHHQVWSAAMVHWWHRRNFAPIPAGRPELVALLLGPRNWHNLGWWNGPWQDCADYSIPVLTLQRGLGTTWTFFQMHLRVEGNRMCNWVACFRVTPKGRFWSVHHSPPSSTGRESSRCGLRNSMWWLTQGIKTAGPSYARMNLPSRTVPSNRVARFSAWRWENIVDTTSTWCCI